jgi:hypothetical protein
MSQIWHPCIIDNFWNFDLKFKFLSSFYKNIIPCEFHQNRLTSSILGTILGRTGDKYVYRSPWNEQQSKLHP